MGQFGRIKDLYFGGDLNASIALTGQVAGRIRSVRPVAEVIEAVAREFYEALEGLSASYARS